MTSPWAFSKIAKKIFTFKNILIEMIQQLIDKITGRLMIMKNNTMKNDFFLQP